ncbi:MAG: RidA family protein [Desulfobacterales bacterium]|nr:RidA family protein [Desulfobacterales bacterium]MDJ0855400.1 RidA family protein [Desulfobacterales bacterium]MDJ0885969.1 RidA family protein [Desulfobacterales bacterium]
MQRQNISSGSPFEKPIGFSRAVRMGDRIAVSGTAPIAADGTTAYPGDMYQQTLRCLEIIREALEKAGAGLGDVIRTRVYLTDADRWQDAASAHGKIFGDIRPACTFIEVNRLIDPDWLVEIEAEAVTRDTEIRER